MLGLTLLSALWVIVITILAGYLVGKDDDKGELVLIGLITVGSVFIIIGSNSNWFKCSYNCAYCKNATNTVYEVKVPEHKYVCEICMTNMISKGTPPTKCSICAEYKSYISLENHKAICSDCKTKE